jgi:hypothetical protein
MTHSKENATSRPACDAFIYKKNIYRMVREKEERALAVGELLQPLFEESERQVGGSA